MAQPKKADSSIEPTILKLPHPYLTAYTITNIAPKGEAKIFQVLPSLIENTENGVSPSMQLHNSSVSFSDIAVLPENQAPPDGNNSSWARTRRAPMSTISWTGPRPTVAQMWLISYALITLHPLVEKMRVLFSGSESELLATALRSKGLFHPHPPSSNSSAPQDGYLLLRSCFWQGAGCPFGSRPVWAPRLDSSNQPISTEYPLFPFQTAPTTQFPAPSRHTIHPIRAPKPNPGSIIYSRWIPHLNEHFSMIALDHTNDDHLNLFHGWQNDPRVAAGWNETGTLDQHREYLKKLHEDPHVLTMFAAFDDVLFAYFEVYWAMEDQLGAHYNASPYDRGRHSLVGDIRFRGPYRVSAWWSGLMHYMFLDEPRTTNIVGEPKATNSTVLAYDFAHGFHIEKLVDLPHKRSALMMVSREKFFMLSPLVWDGEKAVRPSLDALAKL
ncbi:aerobactin siderophore biosynthesis protein iucB [Lindgomyces ingoldianus]|uniref:Aerobactin siderophore biosynthesis protein iucB n=1 Tax=Lindgomyces ingoldianus TaxID=673940 RepID=A0ACB6QQS0_9PLEO|nr:aerobactin siderophore biosynthesis protein iucB [Lindgomyces ingoldianus]KAF2468427.1 aerobactin siderophore biosynthesis protein iucB [Lindgomyces ingoldianus]